jgi:hypothetical protein
MARKHFKDFSVEKMNVKIKLDMSELDEAIQRAQYALDGAIMQSMIPYMPKVTGNFIERTVAKSASVQGTGIVYAGVGPEGRYLYKGKVMVDAKTGKGPMNIPGVGLRYKKGTKLKATERELDFKNSKSHNPDVQKEWFIPAKKKDLKSWIAQAQNAIKE